MRKSRLTLALAPILLASANTLAAEPGPYVGLGLGWAETDTSSGDIERDLAAAGFPNSTSLDDDDRAWRVLGGYRLNPYFAVEGGYVDLGEIKSSSRVTGANPGTIKTTLESDAVFLTALGGYPVTESLFAYGKLGLLRWDSEAKSTADLLSGTATARADDDDIDLTYGVGVNLRVSERFAVRLDWDRYQLGGDVDTDVDVVSIGLQAHF